VSLSISLSVCDAIQCLEYTNWFVFRNGESVWNISINPQS